MRKKRAKKKEKKRLNESILSKTQTCTGQMFGPSSNLALARGLLFAYSFAFSFESRFLSPTCSMIVRGGRTKFKPPWKKYKLKTHKGSQHRFRVARGRTAVGGIQFQRTTACHHHKLWKKSAMALFRIAKPQLVHKSDIRRVKRSLPYFR
eukprot:g47393.t1